MNTLTTKLSQQQTMQSFLVKTIQYLHKYFETVNLQSQQKTYASINKICSKIQSKFNNRYILETLAKKLCLNVETKINDKEEDVESCSKESNKKKTFSGMKSFLINIESAIDIQQTQLSPQLAPIQAPTRLPSTDSEFSWIRKTVLQQLELLQDDIQDADDKIDGFIEQALGMNHGEHKFILIFESFLDNKIIIEKIRGLGWIPVVVRNQKKPPSNCGKDACKDAPEGGKKQQQSKDQKEEQVKEILINEVSSYLHRCHSIIISGDCITKTGGVLSTSGSLMLCLMGRRRHIPIITVSRNYCLSERTFLSQKGLTSGINASEFFKISHDDFGLYVTKNEDFIDAKHIDLMITERGCWMVDDISQVQDQYWRY